VRRSTSMVAVFLKSGLSRPAWSQSAFTLYTMLALQAGRQAGRKIEMSSWLPRLHAGPASSPAGKQAGRQASKGLLTGRQIKKSRQATRQPERGVCCSMQQVSR
jgi:hypothetical protein